MDALTNRGTSGLLLVGLVVVGLGCLKPAGAAPAALDPYPYVSRLRAPRAAERARAARILGYLGTEQEVPALADVLLRDRGRDPRTAAAVALGQIGGEAAAAALSTELLGLLHGRDPIPTTDGGWAYLEAVVGATGLAGGPQALKPLEECAASAEPRLRQAALAALGEQGSAEALALVAAGLGDRNAECRATAARALAAHGTTAQVPQLVAALRAATDDGWALELLNALSGIGTPEAVAGLAAGAELPLPVVRREAAGLLGKQGGPEVAPLLEKLCDDPAALVHEGALPALAEVAPERARGRLVAALQATGAPTVRGACLAAAVMDEVAVAEELATVALGADDVTVYPAMWALADLSANEATSRALARLLGEWPTARPWPYQLLSLLARRMDPVASEYVLARLLTDGPRRARVTWEGPARTWAICQSREWLDRCAQAALSSVHPDARDRALRIVSMAGDDSALELLRQAAAGPVAAAAGKPLIEALMDCPRPEATDLLLEVLAQQWPGAAGPELMADLAARDARCLVHVAGLAHLVGGDAELQEAAEKAVVLALGLRGNPRRVLEPGAAELREGLLDWAMRSDEGTGTVLWLQAVAGDPQVSGRLSEMLRLDEEWGAGGVKPVGKGESVGKALAWFSDLPPSVAAPVLCEFLQRVSQWRVGSETWGAQGWEHPMRLALKVAGQLGDRSAVPLLCEALGDSDGVLRLAAREALAKIEPDVEEPLAARAARDAIALVGSAPRQGDGHGWSDEFELRTKLEERWLGTESERERRCCPTSQELAADLEGRGTASQAERARRWAAWEAGW